MSTLAEIEQAADELPAPQVEQLIEHLAARLQRERAGRVRKPTNLAEFPLVHCAPGVMIEPTKEQLGDF
ncbi:MAG: hypothetical protein WCK55_04000 [Verrucomicrobiota bacterium]